jgi:oxygen-dependent protoporphyrinogen oxidase
VTQHHVVIVGAGIAGLSAAFELQQRGVPFQVLEAGERAGGVILSESIDGFVVDAGPDSLLVQKPEAIRLCEELGLGGRLVPTKPPRLAFIQRAGQLHALPAASVLGIPTRWQPFMETSLFSWPGKIRMGLELALPRGDANIDESIGDFMQRRFGGEAKEYLAEPLLAGIHAGDVDRLSLRALFPRLYEVEQKHGSLLRGLRKEQRRQEAQPAAPGSEASVFRSLPGGLSEMVDALVRALPASSIKVRRPVTSVSPDAPGYRIATAEGMLHAPVVVLAVPAFVAARLVRGFGDRLADLCDAVPYASTATVALAFERDAIGHPLNGSGCVVPRLERTGILAASWLSSKWPDRAPEGMVLLRTFVGGARDPEGFHRSDRELVMVSLKALGPLIGITGEPIFTRVYRWERANAQHEVGHLSRMRQIDEALGALPGLLVTGSGFRGVGIPDCVADGRAMAAKAAGLLNTPPRPGDETVGRTL